MRLIQNLESTTMTKYELKSMIKNEMALLKGRLGSINLMLSGGVDSGTLAGLSDVDRVFTVRLPYGPKHDEFGDVLATVKHLRIDDKLTVVDLDEGRFDEAMQKAVKAIGRPIPHFNIFPLYILFEQMSKEGITDVVCGDGPDETMCGYTRHLIMWYLYNSYSLEAFSEYKGMIGKLLETVQVSYSKLINKDFLTVSKIFLETSLNGGNLLDCMCATDMRLMRPDMDDMSDSIARIFEIKIHRPYQESAIDSLMFHLPPELKIKDFEYGKYLLRQVADEVLPKHIAWRKQKIGGPLVPVNKIKGWDLEPFDKSMYLKYQEDILNG